MPSAAPTSASNCVLMLCRAALVLGYAASTRRVAACANDVLPTPNVGTAVGDAVGFQLGDDVGVDDGNDEDFADGLKLGNTVG